MRHRVDARARRALLLAGALATLVVVVPPGRAQPAQGGGRVQGSGKVIDDERSVPAFSRVVVNGPLDVRIAPADAHGVVVRADDNIAPLVETVVSGDDLVVGQRPGASYRTRTRVVVRVRAAPALRGVVLRGSGDIRAVRIDGEVFEMTLQGSGDIAIDDLQARTVAVSLAGNGDVRAKGTVDSLGVVIDGSGDVHFADLVARTVAVSIRGSGDARVHATEELQVSIAGSGDVRYRGEPKITRTVRGAGEVRPLR